MGRRRPAESAQVEQMLRHDAEYARAYTFMQQTSQVVHTIVEVEPPAFLRDAILAKTSHRLTFAQRLSAGVAALRTQLALPQTARWTLAGGSLATCALLVGVFTARLADNNNTTTTSIAAVTSPPKLPGSTLPVTTADKKPLHETVVQPNTNIAEANPAPKNLATKPATVVDFRNMRSEPAIPTPMLTTAERTKLAKAVENSAPTFDGKIKPFPVAQNKPPRKPVQTPKSQDGPNSDSGVYTQNVSPMMDEGVQHRAQVAMMPVFMRSDDDLDQDVVTSSGDSGSPATPVAAPADTDSAPRRTLVGKLQLSKLPPTARHIQTAADIQRIQESRNMGYAASVMDGVPRRDADISVFSGKF